jgi:hypothetical protein
MKASFPTRFFLHCTHGVKNNLNYFRTFYILILYNRQYRTFAKTFKESDGNIKMPQ